MKTLGRYGRARDFPDKMTPDGWDRYCVGCKQYLPREIFPLMYKGVGKKPYIYGRCRPCKNKQFRAWKHRKGIKPKPMPKRVASVSTNREVPSPAKIYWWRGHLTHFCGWTLAPVSKHQDPMLGTEWRFRCYSCHRDIWLSQATLERVEVKEGNYALA